MSRVPLPTLRGDPSCLYLLSVSDLAAASHIRSQLAKQLGTDASGLTVAAFSTAPASSTLVGLRQRQCPHLIASHPPMPLDSRRFGSTMPEIFVSFSQVWYRQYFWASQSACEPYSSVDHNITMSLPAPHHPLFLPHLHDHGGTLSTQLVGHTPTFRATFSLAPTTVLLASI